MTFLDFEKAACENAVIYVKRRQFAFQLRQQIKDEQTKWGRKKKQCISIQECGCTEVKATNNRRCVFYCIFFLFSENVALQIVV